MNKLTEKYQTIWTYIQRAGALSHTQLLTYAYACKQDGFGEAVTGRGCAKTTGLSERTVADSLARLADKGFMSEGKPVYRSDAFFGRARDGDEHFARYYSFFKCFVRSQNSPLRTTDVMVWSYMMDMAEWKKQPTISQEYIGRALGIDPRTVGENLARLERHQLFRREGWVLPDGLVGQQCDWLREKLDPSLYTKKAKAKLSTARFTPDIGEIIKIFDPIIDDPAINLPSAESSETLAERAEALIDPDELLRACALVEGASEQVAATLRLRGYSEEQYLRPLMEAADGIIDRTENGVVTSDDVRRWADDISAKIGKPVMDDPATEDEMRAQDGRSTDELTETESAAL